MKHEMPSVRFLMLLLPQGEQQFEFGSAERPFQTRLCPQRLRAHALFEFCPKTGAVEKCIPIFDDEHVFICLILYFGRRTAGRTTFCIIRGRRQVWHEHVIGQAILSLGQIVHKHFEFGRPCTQAEFHSAIFLDKQNLIPPILLTSFLW